MATNIVILRRPNTNMDEKRSDPFWEFGSFGCTGCHRTNLLNPKNGKQLEGNHLAFAQEGHLGFKLVFVTDKINIVWHDNKIEAKWNINKMPLKYEDAPVIINNSGFTDIPFIKKEIIVAKRSTWEGKFSSKFRSRRKIVSPYIEQEIINVFRRFYADSQRVASSYEQALPYNPPIVDENRLQTYEELIQKTKTQIEPLK